MKKAHRFTTLSESTPTRYICLISSPDLTCILEIRVKTEPEKIPKFPTEVKKIFITPRF